MEYIYDKYNFNKSYFGKLLNKIMRQCSWIVSWFCMGFGR